MGLGTKNRQRQTAELCKEHLRSKYPAERALAEDYIREIEGPEETADPAQWQRFSDPSHSREKLLAALDEHFKKWLNGDA